MNVKPGNASPTDPVFAGASTAIASWLRRLTRRVSRVDHNQRKAPWIGTLNRRPDARAAVSASEPSVSSVDEVVSGAGDL